MIKVLMAFVALMLAGAADAAAPVLLRTVGYQAPVRGAPDDLLLLAGDGFHPSDRVVYQIAEKEKRPTSVPSTSTAANGTAPIVQIADPAYSITVHLPAVMRAHAIYRLWVVTAQGEWSEPVTINDPRPLWFSPTFAYSTADPARLGRRLRVIGRNLEPAPDGAAQIRLARGTSTIVLNAETSSDELSSLGEYVAEAPLPERIAPGQYTVSFSRDGRPWIEIPDQSLDVRADPAEPRTFDLADERFGGCRPDDGANDSACLSEAIDAAAKNGGGTVTIGPGTWHLSLSPLQSDGIVLPPNVNVRGAGAKASFIVRLGAQDSKAQVPLLTVTGGNSITGLSFSEAEPFSSPAEARRVTIQVGTLWSRKADGTPSSVDDVVIAGNTFRRVGRALVSAGRPINRITVAHNDFGGYHTSIVLTGDRGNITEPFRTDDSVFRWNRFVPGSYTDLREKQGTIATGLGAAHRVDFSSNMADGASSEGLQKPDDAPGFRAAFFWNVENNNEMLLVAQNRITCSGDKVGDGEAIAFDANGTTFGFKGWPQVVAAKRDSVTVKGSLQPEQLNQRVPPQYYRNHWIHLVEGRGLGQSRRIVSYSVDANAGTVTFRVAPSWDVVPSAGTSRVFVARQYWQAYVVANQIDQSSPPCRKANLTGPRGGSIVLWSPSSDSVIGGNKQLDTSGILFTQGFTISTPSCTTCGNGGNVQSALEIRGNVVDGEYDFDSDCSDSGIYGTFGASPTPEAPPAIGSLGVVIAHNEISHADGLYGGAIDIAASWHRGPPPGVWPLVQNPLIFHNTIRNVTGTPPRSNCRHGQRARTGIRLDGPGNVRDAVLYANRCEKVATPLDDEGANTRRLCTTRDRDLCECGR